MSRLFRILRAEWSFESEKYDINGDGTVGWWELCVLWSEEKLAVRLSALERIYLTFEEPSKSKLGFGVSLLVLSAIVVSAGGFIVSTLPQFQEPSGLDGKPHPHAYFETIDVVCVLLFTVEYLVRMISAGFMRVELLNHDELIAAIVSDESIRWTTRTERIGAFVVAWPNLLDLAAIVPFYVQNLVMILPGATSVPGAQEMFKLIRLMRVVRAFRLGKRFEAVQIIVRSMRRSIRALWVLILNILLGMLIFGSLLQVFEQGEYDPEDGVYKRPVMDATGDPVIARDGSLLIRKAIVMERTPFESIPDAFWWALVTATTVGYGDQVPTTIFGRVVAGFTMVWSLIVIALPVGVIGATFNRVWEEFDREKLCETELKLLEHRMVRHTVMALEPVTLCRKLHFEVRHDTNFRMIKPDRENDLFVGEAEVMMPPLTDGEWEREVMLPLMENTQKGGRRVSGNLYISYHWKPNHEARKHSTLIVGHLQVEVIRAEGLCEIDWKPGGLPDAYVMVTAYPYSPSRPGVIKPVTYCTKTCFEEPCPSWAQKFVFEFDWEQESVEITKKLNRQKSLSASKNIMIKTSSGSSSYGSSERHDRMDSIAGDLNWFTEDLKAFGNELASTQNQLSDVKRDTAEILRLLGAAKVDGSPTDLQQIQDYDGSPKPAPSEHCCPRSADNDFSAILPGCPL
jgi:hypothetical protein